MFFVKTFRAIKSIQQIAITSKGLHFIDTPCILIIEKTTIIIVTPNKEPKR